MEDQTGLSDDIPALWGPGVDSVLAPEPVSGATAVRPAREAPPVDADRMRIVEEGISCLAASVQTNQAVLEGRINGELARLHAEAAAVTKARLDQIDAHLTRRLDQMSQQVAAIAASHTGAGPTVDPDPSRLDALERQVHDGLAHLQSSVETVGAPSWHR